MASVPPRSSASRAGATRCADRCEQDGRIQRYRRRVGGALRRRGAQRQRQFTVLVAAGHDVHLGAAGERDLGGDVGAAAETVQSETAAGRQVRAQQRAVADDARAQQRGQFGIGVARRAADARKRLEPWRIRHILRRRPSPCSATAGRGSPGRRRSTDIARRCGAARRSRRGPPPRTPHPDPSAEPSSTTSPTTSCPGVTCGRWTGRSPSVTCRSVRHTPQTRTATSRSCGPGRGIGRGDPDAAGAVAIGPGWRTCHAAIALGVDMVRR